MTPVSHRNNRRPGRARMLSAASRTGARSGVTVHAGRLNQTQWSISSVNLYPVRTHAPGCGVAPRRAPGRGVRRRPLTVTKQVQQLDRVIIRFAGDSGDGMQLAGDRFTQETAVFGNDLSTMPNFPAEIRAPAGTLAGVSSFQLHFADHDILTPGDAPDVLIAMNPAALKANIKDLPRGGDLIVNTDEFTKRNLTKVGYEGSPLEDDSLEQYRVHAVPITSITVKGLQEFDVTRKDAERAKNMFALGMISWLYDRPAEGTLSFLKAKFASKPEIMAANVAALQAGWNYGETTEAFSVRYEVKPAPLT